MFGLKVPGFVAKTQLENVLTVTSNYLIETIDLGVLWNTGLLCSSCLAEVSLNRYLVLTPELELRHLVCIVEKGMSNV